MRTNIPTLYLGYDTISLSEICNADKENGMELSQFDDFTKLMVVNTGDGIAKLRLFGCHESECTVGAGEAAVIIAENELSSPYEKIYIDFEGSTDGVKLFAVCG